MSSARQRRASLNAILTSASGGNQISERAAAAVRTGREVSRRGPGARVARLLPRVPRTMKYGAALVFLLVAGGCYQQANNRAVPAAVVNDSCGAQVTQQSCTSAAGCEWHAVDADCAPGAACPGGVCVTPDPCGRLADKATCEGDARCAWSDLRIESASIDLCLVGQSCDTGGYCRARDASGGGCTCVQPLACPTNADCPAVECECSTPPTGSNGGGVGMCTCTCPACPPGEACAPCACHCGSGASCPGATGGATCTCVCPTCAPGASCAPCDCACGAGNIGVSNKVSSGPTAPAPGGSTTDIPDACAGHGDAPACAADVANRCRWIELGIVCVTTPCPSGACVQVKSVPGGGGCGCACPACAAGQSCPPCACDCCPSSITGAGAAPMPV
jgi:hypothetical protein